MAAKGGIWTKKGFVKAADRKDAGGGVVAVADTDPATRLNSSVSTNKEEQDEIAKEAGRLRDEGLAIYRKLEEEDDLLRDNIGILSGVNRVLTSSTGMAGVIVKDKNGNSQAVAAIEYRKDLIYVDYLATNPKNMDKNNPDAVRGAGTQAMARVAKLAQEKGQPVRLFSLDTAEPFYQKLGFQEESPGSGFYRLSGSNLDKLADRAR